MYNTEHLIYMVSCGTWNQETMSVACRKQNYDQNTKDSNEDWATFDYSSQGYW
jgi:hypothetical protein